jgi:hypothetical protein
VTPRAETPAGQERSAGSSLAERVVAAYGGEELWRTATAVEALLDTGGFLFRWKRGRGLRGLHIRTEIREPRTFMKPFYEPEQVGILDGQDVRLETTDGKVIESRKDARAGFPWGRRFLWWDKLDFAYFFGYAMWNYLTLPALILRDEIDWREVSENTLEATFPPHLPTHCPTMQYHFDPETSLLHQYDYTSEPFGGFAVAAHMTPEHRTVDGVTFASKRRVMPKWPGGTGPMPFPLLIWADLHEYRIVRPGESGTGAWA